MNPTQDAVEQRIASLEGGVAALLVSSGSAATTYAIQNVAEAGDHIVSSPSLYGGTYNLFHYTLKKFGIEVTFVENPDDPESWRKAVRPNTKAFFGETDLNKFDPSLKNYDRHLYILHGDADDRVPLEHSRDFAKSKGAALMEISGADHFAMVDPDGMAFELILHTLLSK